MADLSSSAIGGESPLEIELLAYDAAGNQCTQGYSIAREAAPAQPITVDATPTCDEKPSRDGC